MREIDIFLIDTFTDQSFGGNAAKKEGDARENPVSPASPYYFFISCS